MSTPEVSVIVPVLNGAATIGDQLAALARQTDATDRRVPEFEVLVCDNGSTDGTRARVAQFADQFAALRVLDASDRRGAAHARNVGILAARGRVVAFCDADDVVADDWVASMARFVGPGSIVTGWLDFARLNGPLGGGLEKDLVEVAGHLPGIASGNVALEREAALAVGGFDESYRYAVEDIDFGWRAQHHGLTLTREPAVVSVRLRADDASAFRQHRTWGRGNIMLRQRHRERLGNVMSARYSAKALVTTYARLPLRWLTASRAGRRALASAAGTTLGEFEGHVIFRLLGRMPAPLLIGPASQTSAGPS
ncbi:glycosyltransferase family 2 protein [Aestuariimicrobium soli]|uniref:glycosyltransferase family 2 protein n=1 Tax=Aestuariimicrobium soli TaxID=2035834 RepID=UPI003EBD8D18